MSAASPSLPAIARTLRDGVCAGVFPGAAAAVCLDGRLVHLGAVGDAQRVPSRAPMTEETLFDLASVTKAVATTTAAVALAGRGALALDAPVARYWPAFAAQGKERVLVRHLLAHSSGLPAWRTFFLDAARDPEAGALFAPTRDPRRLPAACRRGRELAYRAVAETPLERATGTGAVYSDLGFVALGRVVEEIAGMRLDRFVEGEVLPALGLTGLGFRPLDGAQPLGDSTAATGLFRPREPAPGQEQLVPAPPAGAAPVAILGEVDDDNAFSMGGVAGHAGLFGTARAVAAWGAALLDELSGAQRLAPAGVWERFCTRDTVPGSTRALGFDTPSATDSSAGRHLAASRAVGHLGFTGTSVWVDLRRRLSIALLTNRVHPSRANTEIRAFRPRFHDAVVEALGLEKLPD